MRMQIVPAGTPKRLHLGMQGENLTRSIEFDLTAWEKMLGPGVPQLRVKRSGEEEAYLVALRREANLAIWDIRSVDTALAGDGKAQLQYWIQDKLAKSAKMDTIVEESMTETTVETPPVHQDWVQEIGQMGARVQNQAEMVAGTASQVQRLSKETEDNAHQVEQMREETAIFKQAAQQASEMAKQADEASEESARRAQTAVSNFDEKAHQTAEELQRTLTQKGEIILQQVQSSTEAAENGAKQERLRAEEAAKEVRLHADDVEKKTETVKILAEETKHQAEIAEQVVQDSKNQQLQLICTPFSERGKVVQYQSVADYPVQVKTLFAVNQEGSGTPSLKNNRRMYPTDILYLEQYGKNILDNKRVEKGSFHYETGKPVPGVLLQERVTYDLPVQAEESLVFSNSLQHNGRIFFWDENGGYLGTQLVQSGRAVKTPPRTARVRLVSAAGGFSESSPDSPTENQLEISSVQTSYFPYRGKRYVQILPPQIYDGAFDWANGILRPQSKMFTLRVADMNSTENHPGWRNVSGLKEVVGDGKQPMTSPIRVSCAPGAEVEILEENIVLYLTGTELTQSQWRTQYSNLSVQVLVPYQEELRPKILLKKRPILPINGQKNVLMSTGLVQAKGLVDPVYERQCLRDAIVALGSV